ncbi:hypothetical protein GCM10023174_10290 [Chelativorans composti]|uniref:Uncharacterized protein n=1 Tax=Chelativorans composti TaxID=768533 RepID=A0ABW5DKW6_9HYPH
MLRLLAAALLLAANPAMADEDFEPVNRALSKAVTDYGHFYGKEKVCGNTRDPLYIRLKIQNKMAEITGVDPVDVLKALDDAEHFGDLVWGLRRCESDLSREATRQVIEESLDTLYRAVSKYNSKRYSY